MDSIVRRSVPGGTITSIGLQRSPVEWTDEDREMFGVGTMGIFDRLRAEMTPEGRAAYDAAYTELTEHMKFRPCPSGCGCEESYDDREPDKPTGGFGIAGCRCARCDS